jgi:type I restriction enzyme S subunit
MWIRNTEEHITEEGLANSSAWVFPARTVLLAMYASIGTTSIAAVPLATNQAIIGCQCSDKLLPEFLWYWFTSQKHELFSLGRGGTQANLNAGIVKALPIPFPPLAEQHRIVAALEAAFRRLDAVAERLARVPVVIKQFRAAVLSAAVEGRLTEDWRADHADRVEPASALLERILAERRTRWETEQREKYARSGKTPPFNWQAKYEGPAAPHTEGLPELPDRWCWAKVDQVVQFGRYGSSTKASEDNGGVPVLRMGNIQNGELDLMNLKYLPAEHSEFPGLLLELGDILFNRTNSPELVGKSAVYKGRPGPCSYASYLIALRMTGACLPDYLCSFINSSYGRAWIASVVSQQVGQANVSGSKLLALAFPLPPSAEQQEIVGRVEEQMRLADAVEARVAQARERVDRLRQALLAKAFRGELVPRDPNGEPVEALSDAAAGHTLAAG